MDLRRPLIDKKLIWAIRQCATGEGRVQVTYRAQQDMLRLDMTLKGVCEAIVDWIDGGREIIQDVSGHDRHAGKLFYIMSPEIDGEKRYIKVRIDEESDTVFLMIVVSAHEYEE